MTVHKRRIRVLMVKPGVDGHWRGAIVVSAAFRDAGMEVIYGGNQMPEAIVKTALQEDVDVIGLSVYSAGHMRLITEVAQNMKKNDIKDVVLIVGGTIPRHDIAALKMAGVDEIFLPGTPLKYIIEYVNSNVRHAKE
jgi:methylmalonyl-CoA mutase C-terminal domain/subunit